MSPPDDLLATVKKALARYDAIDYKADPPDKRDAYNQIALMAIVWLRALVARVEEYDAQRHQLLDEWEQSKADLAAAHAFTRGELDPSWRDKPREELLDALEWQGACTKAVTEQLAAAREELKSYYKMASEGVWVPTDQYATECQERDAARAEAARLRDRWDTLKRDVHDYAAYARGLDRAKAYMHVEEQMAALEKVTAALEADHDD